MLRTLIYLTAVPHVPAPPVSWISFTNSADIAGKDEETLTPFRLDPGSCLPADTTSARM